jgi:hypothetical protein
MPYFCVIIIRAYEPIFTGFVGVRKKYISYFFDKLDKNSATRVLVNDHEFRSKMIKK